MNLKTPIHKTICNPLNLNYRFQIDKPSRREAADPTMVVINGEYFLFASKSEGYWYSSNLIDWTFVQTNQIPVEEYAPTVVVIGDTAYYLASSTEKSTIYKSTNLKAGIWEKAVTLPFVLSHQPNPHAKSPLQKQLRMRTQLQPQAPTSS